MGRGTLCLATLLFCVPISGVRGESCDQVLNEYAPPPKPSSLSYEKLIDLIKRKHPADKAALLQLLRKEYPDYLRSFTLMHASKSSQAATPQNPRVIIYGEDASFILAISGDPTDPKVETIQFDDASASPIFREINLSSPAAPGRRPEADGNLNSDRESSKMVVLSQTIKGGTLYARTRYERNDEWASGQRRQRANAS